MGIVEEPSGVNVRCDCVENVGCGVFFGSNTKMVRLDVSRAPKAGKPALHAHVDGSRLPWTGQEYVGQTVQGPPFGPVNLALHVHWMLAVLVMREIEFGVQSWQAPAPGATLYFPAIHLAHAVFMPIHPELHWQLLIFVLPSVRTTKSAGQFWQVPVPFGVL